MFVRLILSLKQNKMKVSGKVYGIIFSAAISFVMSLFMSFFMIAINVGFTSDFFIAWTMSTLIGFVIGMPIAAIAVPLLQKLLNRYLEIVEYYKLPTFSQFEKFYFTQFTFLHQSYILKNTIYFLDSIIFSNFVF